MAYADIQFNTHIKMTLPEDFVSYTRQLMGDALYQQLEQGLTSSNAPVSIRINPFKCKDATLVDGTPIPWCPNTGRYLWSRPSFTFDPWLHAGLYYVQEASSMMVDLAVRQLVHQPVMMLDLCAAPGGKSTALRAALPEGSLLFSNEPMRTRSQILAENIQKFGHPDMIVTNNYPRDYKKSGLQFDVILTDVPCSGEGMFRKDEGAIQEWSLQNVENCWKLQREIVADIWHCLKPGGILIYSTCTFNAHEDEENAEWIAQELGADFIKLDISEDWNITDNLIDKDEPHPVYRFIPGKTQGEGLFLCVLRKHEDADEEEVTMGLNCQQDKKDKKIKNKDRKAKGKKAGNSANKPLTMIPGNWLLGMGGLPGDSEPGMGYDYIKKEDDVFAIPSRWIPVYATAQDKLKVIHAGIKLGTDKGKGLIPDQSLALSIKLNREAFNQVELSYEDAIRYLRKEAVNLPEGTPKGYVLITYRNTPIGFEKNIGNRANNLYPQEWKIKSTHIPEEEVIVLKNV